MPRKQLLLPYAILTHETRKCAIRSKFSSQFNASVKKMDLAEKNIFCKNIFVIKIAKSYKSLLFILTKERLFQKYCTLIFTLICHLF